MNIPAKIKGRREGGTERRSETEVPRSEFRIPNSVVNPRHNQSNPNASINGSVIARRPTRPQKTGHKAMDRPASATSATAGLNMRRTRRYEAASVNIATKTEVKRIARALSPSNTVDPATRYRNNGSCPYASLKNSAC